MHCSNVTLRASSECQSQWYQSFSMVAFEFLCNYNFKIFFQTFLFKILVIAIETIEAIYRISSYNFRGNYSFLNLVTVHKAKGHSTYKCGNYSREETIQGRKLFAEIRYVNFYLISKVILHLSNKIVKF